jgi:hypothetical protein
MCYAGKNVQASLDDAQSRLHGDDLQAQLRALAREFGQIVSRAAMDAAKPKNQAKNWG